MENFSDKHFHACLLIGAAQRVILMYFSAPSHNHLWLLETWYRQGGTSWLSVLGGSISVGMNPHTVPYLSTCLSVGAYALQLLVMYILASAGDLLVRDVPTDGVKSSNTHSWRRAAALYWACPLSAVSGHDCIQNAIAHVLVSIAFIAVHRHRQNSSTWQALLAIIRATVALVLAGFSAGVPGEYATIASILVLTMQSQLTEKRCVSVMYILGICHLVYHMVTLSSTVSPFNRTSDISLFSYLSLQIFPAEEAYTFRLVRAQPLCLVPAVAGHLSSEPERAFSVAYAIVILFSTHAQTADIALASAIFIGLGTPLWPRDQSASRDRAGRCKDEGSGGNREVGVAPLGHVLVLAASVVMAVVGGALHPAVKYQWLVLGTGNANFVFFVTTVMWAAWAYLVVRTVGDLSRP